jgi:metallo-beta-lactamase family protein
MDLHFLGAATTVTGSQFLIETSRAKVLIDCGMFQGSPNEVIRNRVPLAYEPRDLDAILLTHAHLDHCGLLPLVVREGFRGPIYATAGTQELARLVLLDSGKLQQEFAKRSQRWEARHPDKAALEEVEEREALEAAIAEAEAGRTIGAEGTPTDGDVNDALGRRSTDDRAAPRPTPRDVDVVMSPALIVPSEATVAEQGPLPKRREDVEAGMARTAATPEQALREQPAALEVDLDEPLYTVRDAERALDRFSAIAYDLEREVAPGVFATFLDAGHILGSAIIRLRVQDGDGQGSGEAATERTIVFSGDLGRCDTPIIRDPTILTHADYVVVESTYGGREHEPQEEAVRILAETIRLVADHDGVLLVPSFAIGRTQEIVWQLDRLLEDGAIPALPLYLDSPMATRASDIYRRFTGYYDDETERLLREHETPLDYPEQVIVNDAQESRAIARKPRPYMIVASNGMLTGGRVVSHLRNLIGDSSAVLLFVGYQGQGTLGAHLQAGAKRVKIEGRLYDVRCQVRSISGFSAHADESELLDWVANFRAGREPGQPGQDGLPRRVFLVHGDPEAQQALEPKVRALGFETHVPEWHERVQLD